MKILAIGDPHGNLKTLKKIPLNDVDLILITGDLGKADLARKRAFENIERKRKGLKKLKDSAKSIKSVHNEIHFSTINILKYLSKYAPVYTIQGNVGIPSISNVKKDNEKYNLNLKSTRKEINKIKDVTLIKNRLKMIEGLRIGFLEYFVDTNWVMDFKPSDYHKSLKKAKKQTNKAKKILERFKGVDILVCHQPPYGYLDKVSGKYGAPKKWRGKHAGSKVILNYIKEKQPRYVFCGYIHEGEGKAKIGKTEVYNLGVCGWKIVNV